MHGIAHSILFWEGQMNKYLIGGLLIVTWA